ncbi:MAG: Undecaprenyl-phosphate 4-deoxy-4-formamido-L-arabinose transferase [bacterium ADurb.Bin429]|nr:MAG: Undecaprenyl-phosphate 4-deoxy-4-formamido-L-arabinose transferase [bacterium ADurb.Bin429]
MTPTEPSVSVVIPCYNEEGSLRELHARLTAVLRERNAAYEVLYIDDGSTDGSRELLRELAAADPACRVLFFRRNCGKSAALDAGFRAARGGRILMLDADLQDDPQEIPRFLEALERADMVVGWKAQRHDPIEKRLPSKLFNATVRKLTGVQLHDMNCGFKGFRREVVEEMDVYGELHRYLPVLAAVRGFTIEELAVTHHPRTSGVSKYGFERYLRGLLDLFTVIYITKYRFRPLHLLGGAGFACLLAGVVFMLIMNAVMLVTAPDPAPRWSFLVWMLATALVIIGPLLIGLGLLAEGQLAAGFRRLPPAPVVEELNAPEADHVR